MPPVINVELDYSGAAPWLRNKTIPPRCWVQVYDLAPEAQDAYPGQSRAAVYIDLPRELYQGLSITNGAEHIVTSLWRQYLVHPDRTVYVEHYPGDIEKVERLARLRGVSVAEVQAKLSRLDGAEAFDLVTFEWADGQASNSDWKHLRNGRIAVEGLISEPFRLHW